MDNEKILEAILRVAGTRDDGRKTLGCGEAFTLADELGLDLMDIAQVCNANNVKIVRCQLGCFA
jgi:translation initiation factor IF-3